MSDAARALIAAEIGGELDLTPRTAVLKLRHAGAFLELPASPVTSVQEIKVGEGVLGPTEYGFNRFGVEKLDTWWPAGVRITVSYQTGWAEGQAPPDIAKAEVMIDAWLETEPETAVKSFSTGGLSVSREVVDLPPMAKSLLRKWVRP